jgi:hypothetical protein
MSRNKENDRRKSEAKEWRNVPLTLSARKAKRMNLPWTKREIAEELPQLNKDGKRTWKANADNRLGEIVIRTHLPFSGNEGTEPLSRNHINALTADLVVILPGSSGTLSELQLAWEYGKDIMIFVGEGNVGAKTSEELTKEFRGIEIGGSKKELRSWLKSRQKK